MSQSIAKHLLIGVLLFSSTVINAAVLDIDFNSGLSNESGGELTYNGSGGFQVTFTDDGSSGTWGGEANGVHITNRNNGNIKYGSETDFVLGAFNSLDGAEWGPSPANRHSSGIVANFNQGAELVSFFDSDNDSTVKSLFAFDQAGNLIYQSAAATRQTFLVDTSMTLGNSLIYSVEFDTQAGTAGGSFDGTYFTIDDFHVEYSPSIPEPAPIALLLIGVMGLWGKKRMVTEFE